ncbi:MAG: hypothetical protein ACODAU_07075 [Myxococcota bacterium]
MSGIGSTADVGSSGGPGDAPATREGVDPELLALPAPPRAKRLWTLTLMALVAASSLGLLGSLGDELRYFLSAGRVQDVGEATELDPAGLVPDTYVRVHGTPAASRAVRYGRMWSGDQYAVFPLAGQRHVFVRVALEDVERTRTASRREFAGRLVTLGQLGSSVAPVRRYLAQEMGTPVSSETFVVLADEPPERYWWAVLLGAMCLLFVAVDVALLVRWFRPIKTPRGEGTPR